MVFLCSLWAFNMQGDILAWGLSVLVHRSYIAVLQNPEGKCDQNTRGRVAGCCGHTRHGVVVTRGGVAGCCGHTRQGGRVLWSHEAGWQGVVVTRGGVAGCCGHTRQGVVIIDDKSHSAK